MAFHLRVFFPKDVLSWDTVEDGFIIQPSSSLARCLLLSKGYLPSSPTRTGVAPSGRSLAGMLEYVCVCLHVCDHL